jgi:glycosyltransferase involved in cell wall biosynthesis
MKISIITVVFNNKRYIERAILSVLNQTYKNIEYIVVDGGSTDGTLDIIEKHRNEINYFISEPDRGLYDAMNKGIKKASGDWVIMLNSDDHYVSNDAIRRVAEVLDNSGKNFYYFTMVHEMPNGEKRTYKHPINWLNKFKLWYSAYIPHMTLFVMKKQYDEIGLYDTNFKIAADHDLILRLLKKYKPVFCDIPLTIMRIGGVSSENEEITFRDFRDVTIKNGLPKWLAEIIYKFKVWKYNIKRNRIS